MGPIRPIAPHRVDHREAGHAAGEIADVVVKRGRATSTSLAVRKVAQVDGCPLIQISAPRIRTLEHAHLSEAVEDGALDAVVREGQEVRTDLGVEPLRRFQKADLPIGDQLFQLEVS